MRRCRERRGSPGKGRSGGTGPGRWRRRRRRLSVGESLGREGNRTGLWKRGSVRGETAVGLVGWAEETAHKPKARTATACQRQRLMDLFQDRRHMRLRSRLQGTYLHADEDGDGVSLYEVRESKSTVWTVHRHHGDGGGLYVLLHSAANGRYLAATDAPARTGYQGRRVLQQNYDHLQEEAAILWQPLWRSGGNQHDIWLRHDPDRVYYHYYLRADGKHPRWHNDATIDHLFNVQMEMEVLEWVVEPILSEGMPRLPRPSRLHLPESFAGLLQKREMQLMIRGSDGNYINNISFSFKGTSVHRLRKKLARRLGLSRDVSKNLVILVRAGTYGRFTPLVRDLPRSTEIREITAETAAGDPLPLQDAAAE